MQHGKSKTPATGADVEALCGKCGDVWHVIVAMVGADIVKVQCKECGGFHKYRTEKAKAAPTRRSARASGRAKKVAEPEPTGPTVEPDLSRDVRPYSVSERFEVADRVQHPTFGLGVVEVTDPGKITVFFPVGRKRLAQAAPGPQLERPPPIKVD